MDNIMEWINLKLLFSIWVLVTIVISCLMYNDGVRNPLKWLIASTLFTFAGCVMAGIVTGFFFSLDMWIDWVFP